ncbi:MAG: GtrA family protein, partial [Christensenellaceae bacterium]|nr:GtrA family protein [Christensenellaceae bacterium]
DDTDKVCEQHGALYFNQPGKGFADAFKCGIEKAEREKFLILDGDGSHDPCYIPAIHENFVNYNCDSVIGSRYVKGGKTEDKLSSVIMSKLLNFAFRTCIGIKAKDLSTDFRMYDTEQLKNVELTCENYDVLEEVILKLKLNNKNLNIGEIPIEFKKRVFGESKRRLWDFIKSYIATLFMLFGMRMKANKEFFKNLVLYGLIGGAAAALDYGIFALLAGVVGTDPVVANVAGAVVGFAFTFTLNTFVNFKKTTHILKRLVSYGIICLIGMGISSAALHIFGEVMNVFWLKLIMLVIVSLIQFVLNRTITYGDAGKTQKFVLKNVCYIALLAVSAAAFAIMVKFADLRSFWMDDIFQIDISWQDSLKDMMERMLVADNNPPLSHILTYVWIRIVPYGTVNLKLFNIILVTLGIYVSGLTANRLRGTVAGIITASLVAINSGLVVLAAYTFRPYGLLFLLSALSAYLFVLYRQKGRSKKYFVLLSISLTALVYTHYFGALIIAIMFFGDLVIVLRKRAKLISLLPYVISAAAFIPWFIVIWAQSAERLASLNQQNIGMFSGIVQVISTITGKFWYVYIYLLVLAVFIYKALAKGNELRDDISAVFAVVPVASVLIHIVMINYTSANIYFWERYHVGITPMLGLTLGLGIDCVLKAICFRSKENFKKIFCGIIACGIALYSMGSMFIAVANSQQGMLEPFEECADYITNEEEMIWAEDTLVFCSNYESQRGMEYYLTHKGERKTVDIMWYELKPEYLENVNRVFVLNLHRSISQADIDLLNSEGFELGYQHEELPITVYYRM